MNTQFTALRLAEALEAPLSAEWMKEITLDHIVAELRRLHEVNQELVEALQEIIKAQNSKGKGTGGFIPRAPTRDHQWRVGQAWQKAHAALAKAKENT
jgi:uncharacterized protein (DUF2235 family)